MTADGFQIPQDVELDPAEPKLEPRMVKDKLQHPGVHAVKVVQKVLVAFQNIGGIGILPGKGSHFPRAILLLGGLLRLLKALFAYLHQLFRICFLPFIVLIFRYYNIGVIVAESEVFLNLRFVIIPVPELLLVERQIELLDDGGVRSKMSAPVSPDDSLESVGAEYIAPVCALIAEFLVIHLGGGFVFQHHTAQCFIAALRPQKRSFRVPAPGLVIVLLKAVLAFFVV